MRRILKAVAAALSRLQEGVSRVALVAVRGVDGLLTWSWQLVKATLAGPTAPVDFEPDYGADLPPTIESVEDASCREIGEQAVAAAQSIVRGQGVPAGVDIIVRRWLEGLDRGDLMLIAEADPVAVGRHVAGVDPIRTVEGLAVRRPEPEGDLDRERQRRRRREEREAATERAAIAVRRRERAERLEVEAALLPAPMLSPAGW